MVSEESENVTESLGDLSALGSLVSMGNRAVNQFGSNAVLTFYHNLTAMGLDDWLLLPRVWWC